MRVATSIPDFETVEGYPIDIHKLYELKDIFKKSSNCSKTLVFDLDHTLVYTSLKPLPHFDFQFSM